ncbi:MAG: flagellar protein FliS [Ignavibacteria bacterium]|jgi:flagellin-specific chaperone FliS|nr:flagellar protein FliS [Ignavibacteria bacterium]
MATAAAQLAMQKMFGGTKGTGTTVPSYLEQEVYSWSKEKIILKMYDLFIVSAKRDDKNKMSKVLIELMGSLNFEYEEVSTRLYRLYEYCQRCIFQKKVDEAIYIISGLRSSWAEAFHLEDNPEPATSN